MGIKRKLSDSSYPRTPIPDASRETPISEIELLARTPNESRLDRVNHILYIMSIVVTAAIGIGSVFLVGISSRKFYPQSFIPAVVPTDTLIPTATPTIVSKSAVTLEIFNASGVAGAAAEMAAKLETLGYTVVRIGNAPKQSDSTLSVHPSFADSLASLQKDISSVTTVASVVGTLTDSTSSARIVIGSN